MSANLQLLNASTIASFYLLSCDFSDFFGSNPIKKPMEHPYKLFTTHCGAACSRFFCRERQSYICLELFDTPNVNFATFSVLKCSLKGANFFE